MGLGLVAAFIWIFRVWRTYRELNAVSSGRSAIAFVIFALLTPVAIALQFSIGRKLVGSFAAIVAQH